MIFAPPLLFGTGKKEVHKSKRKNQKVLPSAFSLPPSVEVNLLRFHHAASPSNRDHSPGYRENTIPSAGPNGTILDPATRNDHSP